MTDILNAVSWPIATIICTFMLTRMFYRLAK